MGSKGSTFQAWVNLAHRAWCTIEASATGACLDGAPRLGPGQQGRLRRSCGRLCRRMAQGCQAQAAHPGMVVCWDSTSGDLGVASLPARADHEVQLLCS